MAWFITAIVILIFMKLAENIKGCLTILCICVALIALFSFSSIVIGAVTLIIAMYGICILIKNTIKIVQRKVNKRTKEDKKEHKKEIEKSTSKLLKNDNYDNETIYHKKEKGYYSDYIGGIPAINPKMEQFINSCNAYVERQERREQQERDREFIDRTPVDEWKIPDTKGKHKNK